MYQFKLSNNGHLSNCPQWWINYIQHLQKIHTKCNIDIINEDLKKYNAVKEKFFYIYFESEQDFTFFVLRWS